ncbi:MAG: hypothetical protein KGJ68_04280 [Gammaproteobacteria bacterium]|nr:hypothetical protein [Gammaproteobacteria bacterium]
MPATRKLLLFAIAIYALLPLPWVLWRPVGLFYDFDLARLPVIVAAFVVFTAGWMIGETFRLPGDWFAMTPEAAAGRQWVISVVAILAALACSSAANAILASMGALTIEESTGRERVPFLSTLGNAHIFALILAACLMFPSGSTRTSRWAMLLALVAAAITVGLGLVEERRTAVLLPFAVFIAVALVTGRSRMVWRLLLTAPLFVALFAFTTYDRLYQANDINEDVLVIAGDAVVGRLGNPLLILTPVLENRESSAQPFRPQTLRSVAAALPNLGLVKPPFAHSYGNEFGQQLGLLPPDNDYTGINSGWLGELLLLGGFPALLVGGAVLGWLAASCWQLISVSHPAGVFLRVMVVIFVVSGFQMEVAFPIVSLLRAAALAFGLALAEEAVATARGTR